MEQTLKTVFHRNIQTPRRELKIRREAEYFWRTGTFCATFNIPCQWYIDMIHALRCLITHRLTMCYQIIWDIYKHNLPLSYHWHQHWHAWIDRRIPKGRYIAEIRCKQQTGSYSHFHYHQACESHHNLSIHLCTWPCRKTWETLGLKKPKYITTKIIYFTDVQLLLTKDTESVSA